VLEQQVKVGMVALETQTATLVVAVADMALLA
jgi:hypothetical protein